MGEISIKLSYKELEHLLVDESGKVNPEIGEQIANTFAKKYLKSLIHSHLIKVFDETAKTVINDELVRTRGTWGPLISDDVKAAISRYAKECVTEHSKGFSDRIKDVFCQIEEYNVGLSREFREYINQAKKEISVKQEEYIRSMIEPYCINAAKQIAQKMANELATQHYNELYKNLRDDALKANEKK